MRLRPCGPDAVLVELATLTEVNAVWAALRAASLPGVVELVPAASTVLVAMRSGSATLPAVRAVLDTVDLAQPPAPQGRQVVLPVHYDGPDLDLVADTAELSRDQVVDLHASAKYVVAFCGFAPGFGYLVGLPEPLRQPRLDSPRASVPAGSVGIAGEFTGAYPRSSPGGWRLIGRTEVELFNPRRSPPTLLAPGDRVHFEVA